MTGAERCEQEDRITSQATVGIIQAISIALCAFGVGTEHFTYYDLWWIALGVFLYTFIRLVVRLVRLERSA